VAAKRNGWLEEPLSKGEGLAARVLSLIVTLVAFTVFVVLYVIYHEAYAAAPPVLVNGTLITVDGKASDPLVYGLPLGGNINSLPAGIGLGNGFAYSLVLCLLMGPSCMVYTYAVFDLFKCHFNKETSLTKWLAEAAYTVYLLHPWVVTPLTIGYVAILGAGGINIGIGPEDLVQSGFTSSMDSGDGFIWLGWILVSLLSQLIVWPLAHGVRQMPGLRSIL